MSALPFRVTPVAYGGWENNLCLSNGDVEVVVTLDVGPRIMRYALAGTGADGNVLGRCEGDLGGRGEPGWKLRGGHRLWVAPESPERTYVPDNGPALYEATGDVVRVTTPADPVFRLEKTIELALAPAGTQVTISHRIRNVGETPAAELAIWALTVMAKGGTAILPLPTRGRAAGEGASSAADFAPALTMNLWPYFSFADDRLALGERFLRLHQRAGAPSTKFGLEHRLGWAAYWNQGVLFCKRVPWAPGRYPDGGCNFECYADGDLLELETLSPLGALAAGAEIVHTERWQLFPDVPPPASEAVIAERIAPILAG